MPAIVTCEECGLPVAEHAALVERTDDIPRYFCSERCKLNWAEEPACTDEGE